jgi:hypothetical protein
MAKKQTRRSISVSRATYDRLKAFCESSGISMSQFVENRVGDVLSHDAPAPTMTPRPVAAVTAPASYAVPAVSTVHAAPVVSNGSFSTSASSSSSGAGSASVVPVARPAAVEPPVARPVAPAPITSAAARIAVEPPPPVIKPKSEQPAPKPAEKRPDQIFTF